MGTSRTAWVVLAVAAVLCIAITPPPAFAGAAFPQKGRPISIIVPNAPGGTSDITARLIAPVLEKEFGTPVVVVNKPGAGMQVGLTEAALAKPDGYTMATTALPGALTVYLDPDRQAVPQIREVQQVALHNLDVGAVVVAANSPYRTLKELVDAAKANPKGLKAATDGLMSADHMATLYFNKRVGTDFKLVHFDGGAPATTALVGGHVDVRIGKVGSVFAMLTAGKVRILAVMDKQRSPYCPDVKTFEEEGYKDYIWYNVTGISVPKGTPRPIVDVLSEAIKKTVGTDEAKKRLGGVGLIGHFMGPDEFRAYWKEFEKTIEPLVPEAKKN
jgi:tripartite-type tricarboxylate transporter receptor subunit TctC